jgi:acetylornithine deacetylase/succinyl-diaminopimelate desuccinylase-like protein
MTNLDTALAYLGDHADEHLKGLDEFLRIPSISADPDRRGDVRRAAQWIADELTRIGAEHALLTDTSSHPIVTADWLHAGPDAPTAVVYCHYDVQPVDPLDEWVRPPFEPRYEDDIVYARGSGDDKGQLFMHLKAAEAWLRGVGSLPLNLRFFFEGDEEHEAEPSETFVKTRPELLQGEVCIVSDSDMQDDEGTPAITYGLRGIAYWDVRVYGPFQDLHSGSYGGGADNPANVLVRMLASLERMSARPTFDIDGLWGGYSGEGSKTIIPAFAGAKISSRLVPDQDHREIEQLMIAHLQRIAPPTVRVEVKVVQGGQPLVTPLDHPAVGAAARALEQAFGKVPLYHRSGGSIPVAAAMQNVLGLPSVMVGFASPNGNFHAPNEWMPLANYRDGMDALVRLWNEMGMLSAAEMRGE